MQPEQTSRPRCPILWGLLILVVVAVLGCVSTAAAVPSEVVDSGWVLDGPVSDLAAGPDGVVYAAGEFMLAAPRTGPLALLAPDSSTAAASPELLGVVNAAAPDGTGGWFVGGQFQVIDHPEFENLVHIRAGELDLTWRPNPDGAVTAIALDGQSVFVGGDFGAIGSPRVVRSRLAAIERIGGQARAGWDPSPNGAVSALLLDAGRLYFAGAFTSVGTTLRNRAAAVSASTGALAGWDPNLNGTVWTLCRVGSSVVLGGSFTALGATPRSRLAAVTSSGAPTGWSPSVDGPVRAVAVGPAGSVIVGGSFSHIAGQPRRMIGSVDADSGELSTWKPALAGRAVASVNAITVAGGRVIIGGDFDAAGSAPRRRLAGIDVRTGEIGAWPPSATGPVAAVAIGADGVLLVGGTFGGVGGVERNRLAAFNPATGEPTAWNPGADGPMRSVTVSGSTVYVGGEMQHVGSTSRAGVAAIDASSGQPTDLRADTNGNVDRLVVVSGTLYLAGRFSTIASLPRAGVAAIDLRRGLVTSWDPSPNGSVRVLLPGGPDRRIALGGEFTLLGSERPQTERPGLSALDGVSGLTTPWRPALAVTGSRVTVATELGERTLVGGALVLPGGQTTNVAAIDNQRGEVSPLLATTGGDIQTMTPFQGLIYLGGGFETIGHGGAPPARAGIAAYDVASGSIAGWNPGVPGAGTVNALTRVGPSLWLGGAFGSVGGRAQSAIASFTQSPTASTPTSIAGPPLVGAALSCRSAAWDLITSARIDWTSGASVVGSGAIYHPTGGDRGKPIACRETATNRGGVSSSTSATLTVVGALPRIEGPARVGALLTCVTDPAGGSAAWTRGSSGVVLGSGPRYRVTWSDAGRRVACQTQVAGEGGSLQMASSPPTAKIRPSFDVPDRRGIQLSKVLRARGALVVIPGAVPRRSEDRPRLISVRVQSVGRGLVRVRIAGGIQGVRFARPGRANVQVRAGAAFLPPLRRLDVVVAVFSGGQSATRRATIRLTG